MTETPDSAEELRRRYERERRARREAERIAEEGLRRLYDQQTEITAFHEVAAASNEATDVTEATAAVLQLACTYADWAVGHVYLTDDNGVLQPTNTWHGADSSALQAFRVATSRTPFVRGEGLPGRILATGEPAWIEDLHEDANFPRTEMVQELSLRAGYGFPVRIGGDVAAVMEFFHPVYREPSATVRRFMEFVSAQLARVIERDRAQRALRQQEEDFRQLYENSPIGIYRTTSRGRVLMANPALLRILGFDSLEQLQERDLNREGFTAASSRSSFVLNLAEGGDELSGHETQWVRRDGSPVHVREYARAVRGPEGDLVHYEGWVEDITTQKQAEAAIRESENLRVERDAADAANRAKSTFLAQMSHELRTPLNSVIAMSDMLLKGYLGDLEEEQKEYLGDIMESGQHLLGLINAILDLTKIESGHSPLEVSRVAIVPLLRDSMKIVRVQAKDRQIECDTEVAEDLPPILADERKVRQVVYNLLANAVKFTPDGGRVGLQAHVDDEGLLICVHDTGIGIAEEEHERIFGEFVQADDSLARAYEGTGLGLALVKKFVEQHGGSVWLKSTLGKGSRFYVRLPLEPGPQEQGLPSPVTGEAG